MTKTTRSGNALETAHAHREAVADAITRVEQALRGKSGDELLAAVDRLADLVHEHIVLAEEPGGVLADIVVRAPRLDRAASALRREHRDLAVLARSLLGAAHQGGSAAIPEVRDAALELVDRLHSHRQRGATLLFDAYDGDLGGGD